jgi:hypothetical protein
MAATVSAGEIIERIVATVNGRPILQSDWDEEVRYEAFMNRRSLDSENPDDRKAALDHLIDQELLRQQMKQSDGTATSIDDVEKRIQDVRKLYSGAENEQVWSATLQRYALTQEELATHIGIQLSLERLVEARLRPSVHIDSGSIETYYREKLLPQLRQSGVKEVPLVEVSPKIRELLAQQRMTELLAAWLHDLRLQSRIRMGANDQGVAAR